MSLGVVVRLDLLIEEERVDEVKCVEHRQFDAVDEDLPVFGTMASQFNDPGMNNLFSALMNLIKG